MSSPQLLPAWPVQLSFPAELSFIIAEAAADSIRRALKPVRAARRPRRGSTLRPGVQTPLWNALAAAVRARLTRYGEPAKLARLLGLPRQRMHELLNARTHQPDAERTLLLLIWLQARTEGRDLG
jgi:hypothetical protein